MATCDVCGALTSWEEGTVYTADEFRMIVSMGFEPDVKVVGLGVLVGAEAQQAVDRGNRDWWHNLRQAGCFARHVPPKQHTTCPDQLKPAYLCMRQPGS